MTQPHNLKLQPFRILLESILFVWWYKRKFISCLTVPTLILVSVWALHNVFFTNAPPSIDWAFWFLYQVGFVLFAVSCHRLVLLGESNFVATSALNKRMVVFLFWLLGATIISVALSGISLTLAFNLSLISQALDNAAGIFVVYSLGTLPALYVIGRISLIFPATAVDIKSNFRRSWSQTKGHGWKMLVVIGLYPWLISILLWLIVQDDPSLVRRMITALLYYIGLALEVTALSLTFKCFIPSNGQSR